MPHIFISYAKKDTRELAIQLADSLNEIKGVSAWVDRSLRAGRAWEAQIEKQILRCDTMIVLLSPDVNRHLDGEPESYVQTEISYAKYTAKKLIIPVMAQTTTAPISLTREHYIDFTIGGLVFNDLLGALIDELELDITISANATEVPTVEITQQRPTRTQPTDPNSLTYDQQIELARNFKGTKNSDWTPIFRTFTARGIEFEMCLVPVGSFMMGSIDHAKPVHQQSIEEPYWIAVYPVTNAQWRQAVVTRRGAVKVPEWTGWYEDNSKQDHPVVAVTWHQCHDFVNWLGDGWQMPSELRWEYAARGLDNLIYPFGNEFMPDLVVYRENSNESTAAIGGRPKGASWIGAQDMSGQVWEWQLSEYRDYPYVADDGRENISPDKGCVLRGGGWYVNDTSGLRAANRGFWYPDVSLNSLGFRCARSCN